MALLSITDLDAAEAALVGAAQVQFSREPLKDGDFLDIGRVEGTWPGPAVHRHAIAPFMSRRSATLTRSGSAFRLTWRSKNAPAYWIPAPAAGADARPSRIPKAAGDSCATVDWPLPVEHWSLRVLRKRVGPRGLEGRYALLSLEATRPAPPSLPLPLPGQGAPSPARAAKRPRPATLPPSDSTSRAIDAEVRFLADREAGRPHATVSVADIALAADPRYTRLRDRLQSDRAARGSTRGSACALRRKQPAWRRAELTATPPGPAGPLAGVTVVVCPLPALPRRSAEIWTAALREAGAERVGSDPQLLDRSGRQVSEGPAHLIIVVPDDAEPRDVVEWLSGAPGLHSSVVARQAEGDTIGRLMTSARWAVALARWLHASKAHGTAGSGAPGMIPDPWAHSWVFGHALDKLRPVVAVMVGDSAGKPGQAPSEPSAENRLLAEPGLDELAGITPAMLAAAEPRLAVLARVLPECADLVVAPDPAETRRRIAATLRSRRGVRLATSAVKATVAKAAAVVELFYPWIMPSSGHLRAEQDTEQQAGVAAKAGRLLDAVPARPPSLPDPQRLRSLVTQHCANPELALEVSKAAHSYSGSKSAGPRASDAFKEDAFRAFAFRLSVWPLPLLAGGGEPGPQTVLGSALRPLHGTLTPRQRDRVAEFRDTGRIARGDRASVSHQDAARIAFESVHGVGPARAEVLWRAGVRSPGALLALPPASRRALGVSSEAARALRYFRETSRRIERSVTSRLTGTILAEAKRLLPGVEMHIGGSFRRGESTSGDVDVLLFHPDGPCPIVPALVARLSRPEVGVLVEHLRMPSPTICVGSAGVDSEFPGLRHVGPDLLPGDRQIASPPAAATGSKARSAEALSAGGLGNGMRLPSEDDVLSAFARLECVQTRDPSRLALVFDGSTGAPPLQLGGAVAAFQHSQSSVASSTLQESGTLHPSDEPLARFAAMGRIPATGQYGEPSPRGPAPAGAASEPIKPFPARLAQQRWGSAPMQNAASADASEGPERKSPGFHGTQLYCGIARVPEPGSDESPPGRTRFVRIDIKAWHWSQRGPALVAYTGNARFNRALRRYADAVGMHLSGKCLSVRSAPNGRGEHWHEGALKCGTEEAVFAGLGLEPRAPHERLVYHVDDLTGALDAAVARKMQ